MKWNFSCPSCGSTLPSTWFMAGDPDMDCPSCTRKLNLQGYIKPLALAAMAPAMFVLWAMLKATGKWNQEVSPLFFSLSMATMAAVYLPTSWLLIVNLCKWNVVGQIRESDASDNKLARAATSKNTPRQMLLQGLQWGLQGAVIWSAVNALIYGEHFTFYLGNSIWLFVLGGILSACIRMWLSRNASRGNVAR